MLSQVGGSLFRAHEDRVSSLLSSAAGRSAGCRTPAVVSNGTASAGTRGSPSAPLLGCESVRLLLKAAWSHHAVQQGHRSGNRHRTRTTRVCSRVVTELFAAGRLGAPPAPIAGRSRSRGDGVLGELSQKCFLFNEQGAVERSPTPVWEGQRLVGASRAQSPPFCVFSGLSPSSYVCVRTQTISVSLPFTKANFIT